MSHQGWLSVPYPPTPLFHMQNEREMTARSLLRSVNESRTEGPPCFSTLYHLMQWELLAQPSLYPPVLTPCLQCMTTADHPTSLHIHSFPCAFPTRGCTARSSPGQALNSGAGRGAAVLCDRNKIISKEEKVKLRKRWDELWNSKNGRPTFLWMETISSYPQQSTDTSACRQNLAAVV